MINILLTCAGRRNYLVDYFRQALAGRGQVFASDAALSAPALQEADRAFQVPAGHRSGLFQHPVGDLSGTPRSPPLLAQRSGTAAACPSALPIPRGRHHPRRFLPDRRRPLF